MTSDKDTMHFECDITNQVLHRFIQPTPTHLKQTYLRMFLSQFLGLLDDLLDWPHHVESLLGKWVVLTYGKQTLWITLDNKPKYKYYINRSNSKRKKNKTHHQE